MDRLSRGEAKGQEDALSTLAGIAERAGADRVAHEARELGGRLAEGRFFVACVGQFKRGKSTLLNALIGESLLPVGVVPVTSAITIVRKGPHAVRVLYEGGRRQDIAIADLSQYVSEQGNPGNRKSVRVVEVFSPSPLLDHGLCLVDTPGLGSATKASDGITREFLPQIDVALMVTGADPPLSGDEVALAEGIAGQARNFLVVLNKADRLTEREREGAAFATSLLSARLHRPIGRVYQVSARERLVSGAETRDWSMLRSSLENLARNAGRNLVELAELRALERLKSAIAREIDERQGALLRPLEESQARLGRLREQVGRAAQALGDLGVLLAAEQARLSAAFRRRQEDFLPGAQEAARLRLRTRIRELDVPRWRLRDLGFEAARTVSSEIVERFRSELEPEGERLYGEAMERFVELANEFLDHAAREPDLGSLARKLGAEGGLRVPSSVYYTELRYTTLSPLGWVFDALRTRCAANSAVHRATVGCLERLVESNSSRIASDLVERLATSRSKLEEEIRGLLQELLDRAGRAADEAERKRASGQEAVQEELSRLEALRNELLSLTVAEPPAEARNG